MGITVTDKNGKIIHIDQTESSNGVFSFKFKTPDEPSYTTKIGGWFLEYPFEKTTDIGNTVYVSVYGLDTNPGTESAPVKTMERAFELACSGDTIMITDTAKMPSRFGGEGKILIISGGTLDFNDINSFNAGGSLVFKDITLNVKSYMDFFANGHSMTFDTGVNILDDAVRISLYGGSEKGTAENTRITVKSGLFENIYGGSKLCGSALNTEVSIEGGYVRQNVYGGNNNGELTGNTSVSVSGGSVYSVFGGNRFGSMNGCADVDISGGEVRGSVFGGCGNSYSFDEGFQTAYFVDGLTNITISGEPILCSENQTKPYENGIYGGSCYPNAQSNGKEINSIVFQKDCYEKYKDLLTVDAKYAVITQNLRYIINSGSNGAVYATDEAGIFNVVPENGYLSKIGSDSYCSGGMISFKEGTSHVSYAADYVLGGVSISRTDTAVSANVKLSTSGLSGEYTGAKLMTVLYEDGAFAGMSVKDISVPSTAEYGFEIKHRFKENSTYTVKIMLFDSFENLVPLMQYVDETLGTLRQKGNEL